MGTVVSSKLIKFLEEDVNFSSQISTTMLTNIAAALNGFCDFSTVMCTELTGTGTYTTKSKSSTIVSIGIGGAGGGGGGGNGGFVDFLGVVASMNNPASGGGGGTGPNRYALLQKPSPGSPGSPGTDTTFAGQVVAGGGGGGGGGWEMRPFWDELLTTVILPNVRYGQELVGPAYNAKFECIRRGCREQSYIEGVPYGKGGDGGSGSPSQILGANLPSTIGTNTWTYSGLNGIWGQPGNLDWKCIENIDAGTSYPYSVGTGGAPGAGGADLTVTFGGNTFTKSNNSLGTAGEDGGLLIIELGF